MAPAVLLQSPPRAGRFRPAARANQLLQPRQPALMPTTTKAALVEKSIIPSTYGSISSGPSPGAVVGITLGSVAGFLILMGLVYVVVNYGLIFGGGGGGGVDGGSVYRQRTSVSVVDTETSLRTASFLSRRSARRSGTSRTGSGAAAAVAAAAGAEAAAGEASSQRRHRHSRRYRSSRRQSGGGEEEEMAERVRVRLSAPPGQPTPLRARRVRRVVNEERRRRPPRPPSHLTTSSAAAAVETADDEIIVEEETVDVRSRGGGAGGPRSNSSAGRRRSNHSRSEDGDDEVVVIEEHSPAPSDRHHSEPGSRLSSRR